jgi:hypothetical protein
VAKGRKPAIELAGRSNPKSPLDDAAKWLAKQGGKQLKKADIQHIKRYARGIGWSGNFEKRGLADAVERRVVNNYTRDSLTKTGKNTGSRRLQANGVPRKISNKKSDKLAEHKLEMYYKKQDKYARTYGDSRGPHDRFFSEMPSGRAPRKEFNRRMNSAWRAEVEIGRKQGAKNYKATKRALTPKAKVPKKK